MSVVRPCRRRGPLVLVGIFGWTLAGCSGHGVSATSTTRPGTGFLPVETRPLPSTAEAAQLVKEGCRSLPGVPAAVAGSAAAYSQDPSRALLSLYHGPWYDVTRIVEVGTDPAFTHIAADAETLDLATLAGLRRDNTSGLAASMTHLTRDCSALRSTDRLAPGGPFTNVRTDGSPK